MSDKRKPRKLTSKKYRQITSMACAWATANADHKYRPGLCNYTDLWDGLFEGFKAGFRAALKKA